MNQNWVQESILAWLLFNSFPSSILDKTRQDLSSQPLDREPSPLTTGPDSCPLFLILYLCKLVFFDQNSRSLEIGLKKRDPRRLIMSRFFLSASPTFPTTPTTTTAKKCRPFLHFSTKEKCKCIAKIVLMRFRGFSVRKSFFLLNDVLFSCNIAGFK
jgi:hypothetical protein